MTIEPGEYTCPKCKGNGKYAESHSHAHPSHNHNHRDSGVHSSYAVETICNRCCGSGKIDWIQNAMGEQKSNPLITTPGSHTHTIGTTIPNDNVEFYHNGTEMLKIAKDEFYIQGRKVNDDQKIYDRFNKWLVSSGF